MKTALKKITPFISILFFGLAVWFLDQELRTYDMSEVLHQLASIPNHYIALSLFFSFLSYLILTGYDALGVRFIGERLSAGRVVRAGFVGYAFSHNIGMALLTGGSIRYRIYSAWGFSGIQVTQIVAFSALTLWIGFCSVAGTSLLFFTPDMPQSALIPFQSLKYLGGFLLLMTAGYLVASVTVDKEISIKGWSLSFPDLELALKQVAIASVDWVLAGLVLYVLLPDVGITFPSFIGVFLLAQIIGLTSQVPGGLGVFESVMLLYLSNFMAGSAVLGILVVYRIIYYILPLLAAVVVLAYQEYLVNRRKVRSLGQKAASWIPRVVPHVLSVSVFIGGAILLFSGSMPSEVPRMQWLQVFLPLPVIEMSHFFASLVGAGMMVLARSLQRRVRAAWQITMALLTFGVLFSLLRGGDYEEASILAVMFLALVPCREEFHRRTSLISKDFSSGWLTLLGLVFISVFWLGLFSYRHVSYQEELWWQFTLQGDAPRYLRAMVGVLSFTFIIALIKILKPRRQEVEEPDSEEMERVRRILFEVPYTKPRVALLRNKDLFFNEQRDAFIMHVKSGNFMVSMGDPVGPPGRAEDLIFDFDDYCNSEGYMPCFYQVRERYLDYYVDLGLTLLKIGEEARVALGEFRLEDDRYRRLRERMQQFKNEGMRMEVIPPREIGNHLSLMKGISEEWKKRNGAQELGFAHGVFDEKYLMQFPAAIVYYGDRAVAFSTVWEGADRYELAFDLLRSSDDAPEGTILFMLMELMSWGRKERYQWFSLGMAPLSGLKGQQHTARWHKVADWVYTYGDNIHSFREVRAYREQFDPVWEPRYLAVPGGWTLPSAVSNVGSLALGGFRGLIRGSGET